ncbi:transcriptional regulator family: bZIP [Paecilomyces variotii]|nr:transcriptional regulator family: bZIP [Paecilomyces variotii]
MARYSQQSFDFYSQSPSALDSKAAFSEEDEMSVLDDKILDSTTPDISLADPRRTSYDQASETFSHREPVWSDFQTASNPQSCQDSQMSNSIFETSNNPFVRLDASHPAPNYVQQTSWPLTRDSGSCTPTALYEQFPQEFDGASSAPFAGGAVGPVSSINFPQMQYRPGTAFGAPGAVAMSPQSSQGWMATTSDVQDRSRPNRSPTYRNSSPLHVRRDGIRKKNARFEIPAERTLSNIDQLIGQSTNEEEIKELKQQKRLLRNRQAALDSRQRKKLHTEKLEEEKKHFSNVISELEEALHSMKLREAELLREKGEWMTAQQQINQYIDNLHMDKDELIRQHTLETAELRKKNNILREALEKLESQARVSNPTTFTNEFSDFENLTMDNSPWEDFSMVNSLSLETEAVSAPENSMVVVSKPEKASDKPSSQVEYPFSWNAFYMCLLFGAFIASNSSSLSNRAIPQLSEEYRAESANVLKAVLASAPPEVMQSNNNNNNAAVSASATTGLPTTISGAEMAQMTGTGRTSNLDELHNTLAMPSKEQEHQQVFALNADQYNSLTTFEDDVDFKPQQPSNLQQALAAMRSNGANNRLETKATSEVYSRSLLWDRVPEKVVRDFRRMVRECGAGPIKEEQRDDFCQS